MRLQRGLALVRLRPDRVDCPELGDDVKTFGSLLLLLHGRLGLPPLSVLRLRYLVDVILDRSPELRRVIAEQRIGRVSETWMDVACFSPSMERGFSLATGSGRSVFPAKRKIAARLAEGRPTPIA